MSSLRERLQRHLKPADGSPDNGATPGTGSHSDAPFLKQEPQSAQPDCEWEPVGAALHETEFGAFILRRRRYPASHRHGRYALGELLGRDLAKLAPGLRASSSPASGAAAHIAGESESDSRITANPRTAPVEQWLFIDTETTGLGLGVGNIPFMIGAGYCSGNEFVVEQMLMRHPGEEFAMLHYLQQLMESRPYIISFNGKSFDWPIVKSRYIMNRIALSAEPLGHIDFLYPSRSLWRRVLPSCRLSMIEEERLGVMRQDDVPGSLAPALYFQYLAEKDPGLLSGVFEHNELDVLSLASLSIHFSKLAEGEIGWEQLGGFGADEIWFHGLWLVKAGLQELAGPLLERLSSRLLDRIADSSEAERLAGDGIDDNETEEAAAHKPEKAGALLPLAQYFKQQGRFDLACRLWQRYIADKQRLQPSLEPWIELSMHYEHREKNIALALEYAEQALHAVQQRERLLRPAMRPKESGARARTHAQEHELQANEPSPRGKREKQAAKQLAELEKRCARLRGKLQRSGGGRPAASPDLAATGQDNSPARKQPERKRGVHRRKAGGEPGLVQQQWLFDDL